MLSIRKILPETKYEKESLTKSFLLFFISMEILLIIIAFLYYSNKTIELEKEIFLRLKNYSYKLKGESYKIELEERKKNISFYQLYKEKDSYYIYVPIPFVKKEVLKITYPSHLYKNKVNIIKMQVFLFLLVSTVIILLLSIIFSVYSMYPIRQSIQLINEFIKDIVHDINTPLSSLLINLKILKLKYNDEEIDRIETSVKRLNSLFENLTFINKQLEKNLKNVNVKELIIEEIDNLKSNYPDIKIKLNLENVSIYTDPVGFRRIISNLLINSFKHNTKNGWIKINLTKSHLQIINSSHPIKNINKLFDRYYKESQRGIGIGLSIVKKLADELNLQIKVSYKEGKFISIIYFK